MAQVRTKRTRQQVREALAKVPLILSGKIPDPTGKAAEVTERVARETYAFLRRAFLDKSMGGIDEAGNSWPELAPSTIAARDGGPNPPILIDTGKLYNSITWIVDGPGRCHIEVTSPYASYHHEGSRPFWPEPQDWPEAWRERILSILRDGASQIAQELLRNA